MEKVSIIIPFYNCAYVGEAIQSALNQTYPNIEIIVVNDGSIKHKERVTPYLQSITYIEKQNGGTASALNAGISRATGTYFCWLSSDDSFEPDKVEKQVAFMKETGASISYSSYVLMDHKSTVITGPLGVHFPNRVLFYRKIKMNCPINGCTVMIKMSIFRKVGLFDETLPFTHDYDLWLRIVQHYDFYFLNQPLVRYRVHDEMGTKKNATAIRKEILDVRRRHIRNINRKIIEEIKGIRR
ncbi:glycosyltransferase [Guptibacillus algicola]|uniref:glycosyltransferase n=1 Tax=Guptibacillus algicola TaxID=225844 RepID=UPI001CD5413D|nr:glycosyltransferase [Alkalihalobacillus algicola]MCA0987861.1 glycosyltransferase [Alkalihalobacillus algicola]